jgi:hypothetical protein
MSPTIVTLRNMAQHVFVDESKARAYLLVAVAVDDREVAGLRNTMRSIDITVIRSSLHAENRARDECFAALATAIRWLPSSTLVIERDESRMHVDPRIVHDAFQALADQRPRYEVMPARAEPGLWAADAVAWAIQRGNEWAERVAMHEIHWVDLRG